MKDNFLTIDVEDYFQVENFKKTVKFSDWGKYSSRVVRNTGKTLEILAEANAKITFFVLGWVAERFPEVVKKISLAGHEIASHGYAHQLIYKQSQHEFREDIKRAKDVLENITSQPVLGYRAPNYSITNKCVWAMDILLEEGFKYDSSVFPIYHDRGGLPQGTRFPYKICNGPHCLCEFPISTTVLLNNNFPFSGGGYFRLLPYAFVKQAIKKINQQGYPAVIYLHPWELDPQQPRIKTDYISRFRHYTNIGTTEKKLRALLKDFNFKPIKDALNEYQQ
ncbi:XrtA system polysaccharide deacetylase [Candidatus Omnitrophota bacterium]